MSASPAYALRAECRGHEDDVRGVAVMAPDAFATCSRDKTVRVWREAIGDDGYATAAVCVGHASFVTALAFVPANAIPSLPSGGVVSGGRDTSVFVWGEPMSGEPVARLEGHSLDVTAVCVLNDGTIVSGAMDKSIKVWSGTNLGTCVKTLADAHGSSVLALVALPETNGFLSGSADKTIKVWNDVATLVNARDDVETKPSQTLLGHGDTVRGLAIMPGVGFLSASHDCTARLWSRDGETSAIFAGHAALVYSVASIRLGSGSLVVTGSEDNTCKLWNPLDGSCVQTLAHPGCVWAVAGGLGGLGDSKNAGADVVTCCADGVARVWTRDAVLQDAAAQKRLDDALLAAAEQRAQTALAEQQKKIKTEPPEFLERPGAADGATAVIREAAGSVAAYAWNAGTRSWERLGEVTGVQNDASDTKKHVNGVAYDFVFDVDIAEGAPTLKLPFNVGENPYDAAERFLETNGLDPGYREQVVNFITQNVGEDAFKNAGSDVSADPFTGAGAYVPSAPGAYVPGATGGGRTDPFTGAGAYVPSAHSGAALAGAAERKQKLFQFVPAKPHQCVVFPTAAFDKMLAKIKSLGASEEEFRAFAACASADDAPLDPSATAALTKALADWPVESLFPLLDLCKALCARFDTDAGGMALGAPAAAAMAAACARAASAAPGPNADANALTAARLFANAFQRSSPRKAFASTAPSVLDGLARNVARNADAKPVARLALATALLNVSAHFSDSDASSFVSEEIAAQAASVGAELLMRAMPSDGADAAAEVLFFRGLVALGTFAAKSPGTKASLRDLGVAELAEAVRSHVVFKGGNAVRAAEDVKKALE